MTQATGRTSPCSEFERADLKDARLTARLCRVVEALSVNPAASFPQAMPSEAELEGFYRLVRNEKVTFDKVVSPHVVATVQRAGAHDTVLVVHDTTEVRFQGEARRAGLGRVGQCGPGFFGHLSLVLASDNSREPLGVVATQTWTRQGKSVTPRRYAGERKDQEARMAPGRESERWAQGVELAEAAVAGQSQLVHVMDREGDNCELMTGEPTVRDAWLAVAKLGGHLRNNGEPGWLVLGRGYDELLTLEVGFRLASPQLDPCVV